MLFKPQGLFGMKEISFVKCWDWLCLKVKDVKNKKKLVETKNENGSDK